jgi:hypothetical protein
MVLIRNILSMRGEYTIVRLCSPPLLEYEVKPKRLPQETERRSLFLLHWTTTETTPNPACRCSLRDASKLKVLQVLYEIKISFYSSCTAPECSKILGALSKGPFRTDARLLLLAFANNQILAFNTSIWELAFNNLKVFRKIWKLNNHYNYGSFRVISDNLKS